MINCKSYLITLLLISATAPVWAQWAKIDSLFMADAGKIAGKGGGVTMIIMKDDKMLFNKSSGAFNADKQILIASASKWYSAAVIMSLVDEGKLSLDDKVSKYIPSFMGDKASITLRQCYSHTSGLPPGKHSTDEIMSKGNQTYAQMVDEIARLKLIATPGTEFDYGGLSMQVAGRVAEIVTGKKWNDLFKERVTGPLEMNDTFFAGARLGRVPRLAGGAVSTANDYLKFLLMLQHGGMYKGKRIFSEATVKAILADQTRGAAIGYSPFNQYKRLSPGEPDARYGIGNWLIKSSNGNEWINASLGLFGFTPWIDVENGYTGVIALRSDNQKVMPFFRKMLALLKKG